jgi:rRNA-processing protein FCF1
MIYLIIDTNFLLLWFRGGLDIESKLSSALEHASFKLITTTGVIEELKTLSKTHTSQALEAKKALLQENLSKFKIFPSEGPVDASLLKLTQEKNQEEKAILCSLDQDLTRKAREKGLTTITINNKRIIINYGASTNNLH